MIADGAESCIHPIAIAGFARCFPIFKQFNIRAKALATTFNNNPPAASRPFDASRSGFVIAEGAGLVVLEELEHAKKRGATPYAEVLGYGLSSDAHDMTAPPSDGQGAYLAMN
jgi:3-oxoacyl-[acyl-carrier-protein] synthase II